MSVGKLTPGQFGTTVRSGKRGGFGMLGLFGPTRTKPSTCLGGALRLAGPLRPDCSDCPAENDEPFRPGIPSQSDSSSESATSIESWRPVRPTRTVHGIKPVMKERLCEPVQLLHPAKFHKRHKPPSSMTYQSGQGRRRKCVQPSVEACCSGRRQGHTSDNRARPPRPLGHHRRDGGNTGGPLQRLRGDLAPHPPPGPPALVADA